jgi:hypothetical protein
MPQSPVEINPNSYEIKLRILGNEVFAFGLSSSSSDNRWVALALVSIFCFVTLAGAYGEKLINLYKAF